MTKISLILVLFLGLLGSTSTRSKYITKQGEITFFSYTTVENIQATNNVVYSIVDLESDKIAISILMKAFEFDKSLMESHFNESYIESDLYPQATFTGDILNYDKKFTGIQTKIIKGEFTLRGYTQPLELKAQITNTDDTITITGETELKVQDYHINIPPILKPNIADNIKISFNLIHRNHED